MNEFKPEIDLHFAQPRDTKALVEELITEAHKHGVSRIRIIHGKGKSVKKLEVYQILEKHPLVHGYDDDGANWGATIVDLET